MKAIRATYQEFWSSFLNRSTLLPSPAPIAAYQEGYAVTVDEKGKPKPPEFPYITYQVTRPAFGEFALATASIWNRDAQNPGNFKLVDDVLEQAEEKIPEGGLVLETGTDGGGMWILRSNPFIDCIGDPDDQAITRGIIRYIVKMYVM